MELPRETFDGTTRAILKQVESLGFALFIRDEGRTMSATHSKTMERFDASGDDAYHVACDLAQRVGINLVDG